MNLIKPKFHGSSFLVACRCQLVRLSQALQARFVADMFAARQTILTCRDGLKVASIVVIRGCYEETAPVEFRLSCVTLTFDL